MTSQKQNRDPSKRAAKRKRQRAAGYQGVKKGTPGIMQHNSGRAVGGRAAKDAKYARGEL